MDHDLLWVAKAYSSELKGIAAQTSFVMPTLLEIHEIARREAETRKALAQSIPANSAGEQPLEEARSLNIAKFSRADDKHLSLPAATD